MKIKVNRNLLWGRYMATSSCKISGEAMIWILWELTLRNRMIEGVVPSRNRSHNQRIKRGCK